MSTTLNETLSMIKEFLDGNNDSHSIDIQTTVRTCMTCLKDKTLVASLSKDRQTEIKELLLSLLNTASNPKETNLLAAIGVCLLLHEQPAKSAAAEFLSLLERPSPLPGYHQQTLLLGLCSCGRQELLSAPASDDKPLALHLSRAVLQLCATPHNVFQSFHLLDLLLRRLHPLTDRLPPDSLTSDLLRPAAAALSASWERQCDGLPELLTRCCTALLQLHARLRPGREYVDELLRPLAALPWTSKAKLHTLYVISRHIGCQELMSLVPDLLSGLMEAVSGHHLASVTTDLYQEVLQTATAEQLPQMERQLADLLVSEDSQTCQTALLRWLPSMVRAQPSSGRRLLSLLPADGAAGWTARLAAVRLLRASGADTGTDAEAALLAGLAHPEPAVRLAAAGACWGRRATEPPPAHLCPPLLRALVSCLPADSASLRHALCAELRRLVPRLRGACLRGRPPPDHLLLLLQGLGDAVLEGLSPGSSFQRRCTCLVALQEIVLHLYAPLAGAARKGVVPPQTASLLRYLSEHRPGGVTWDFVNHNSLRALLLCLYDETDDVRETALRLLVTHWVPAGLLTASDSEQLTDWVELLADRPNFHDVETAAALCRLVYEAGRSESGQPPAQLLETLLAAAQRQAEGAKRDLYRAAREAPVHGRLACLRQRLCGSGGRLLTPEMVEKCVMLLEDVVDTMLKALAGHRQDEHGGTAPSFAAMGEAVESVVAAAAGDSARSTALSNQYQLVLSCCWLNLKECSLFLGELVSCCLSPGGPGMPVDTLRSVVRVIRRVLTGCRHKGAIESARLAWSRLSTAALRHSSAAVRDVPAAVLRGVLAELRTGGARSSVTRRGAGLPMLVHTLLAAEKQPGLADQTVTALLEVAASPVPPSPTSTPTSAPAPIAAPADTPAPAAAAGTADAGGAEGEADLPHTIALHILTGLLSDAVVSAQVTSRLCDVTCAALAGLASPVWSIRNASLVLYGAVVPRLIGQRKSRDDVSDHNSVPFGELFGRWPVLAEPLLALLASGGPALVAALTLLARVTAAGASAAGWAPLLERYRAALVPLLGSPAAAVRQLTARCLSALLTEQQLSEQLSEQLADSSSCSGGCNRLHGQLLLARLVARRPEYSAAVAEVCRRGLTAPPPAVQHLALELTARQSGSELELEPALRLARRTALDGAGHSWEPGYPLLFATSVQVLLKEPTSATELTHRAATSAENPGTPDGLTDPLIEAVYHTGDAPSGECAVLCARRAGRLLATGSRGRRLQWALELALRHPDGAAELGRLVSAEPVILTALRTGPDLLPALAELAADSDDPRLLRAACERTRLDSVPRRSQDARRDAANALSTLWSSVMAAEEAELRLHLLLAAAALLQDEEQEVRAPATAWAAPLLAGRTTTELLSRLLSDCASCESAPSLALRLVTPSPPAPRLITAALSSGHLFQPGPDNPSCEPARLLAACAPLVSAATGAEPELRQLWRQAAEAAELLESCRSLGELTRVLTGPGVYGAVECLSGVLELRPPSEEFPGLGERVRGLLTAVKHGKWTKEVRTEGQAASKPC